MKLSQLRLSNGYIIGTTVGLTSAMQGKKHVGESFFDGITILSWGLSSIHPDQSRLLVVPIVERGNYRGGFVF